MASGRNEPNARMQRDQSVAESGRVTSKGELVLLLGEVEADDGSGSVVAHCVRRTPATPAGIHLRPRDHPVIPEHDRKVRKAGRSNCTSRRHRTAARGWITGFSPAETLMHSIERVDTLGLSSRAPRRRRLPRGIIGSRCSTFAMMPIAAR